MDSAFTMQKLVSIQEAAEILSVSSATIRNWIRHEYLKPTPIGDGIFFRYRDVHQLRETVEKGSIGRLNSRANKKYSNKISIPEEYSTNQTFLAIIEELIERVKVDKLDVETTLLICALGLLSQKGMFDGYDPINLINCYADLTGRSNLLRELRDWYNSLGRFTITKKYSALLKYNFNVDNDPLGLIYQSLKTEGIRSRCGSYYTPNRVVSYMINTYASSDMQILDPCCGTGQFLCMFGDIVDDPTRIYGIDLDEIAVRIARINLMIKYRSHEFTPKIFHGNFLFKNVLDDYRYDFIATNPPWGQHFCRDELRLLSEKYPLITSHESFSYFIYKSIQLLKNNGILSFILPESILNVKIHEDIRRYIVQSAEIERIMPLGRIFHNVFSPVIRLDIRKKKRCSFITGAHNFRVSSRSGSRYLRPHDLAFNIHINSETVRIIDKIYTYPYITLKGNAEWALGIVTGDNRKFIRNIKIDDTWEPIYRGKDVRPYFLREPSCYICYDPDRFQQSAPLEKYREKEKLVYRFIAKRLIFACDTSGSLTLNSANLVIPRVPGYAMKIIMALFNSTLYQFIYQKRFFSLKVLRSHLEELPIPLFPEYDMSRLASAVEMVLSHAADPSIIDDIVMHLLSISGSEREYIERSVV